MSLKEVTPNLFLIPLAAFFLAQSIAPLPQAKTEINTHTDRPAQQHKTTPKKVANKASTYATPVPPPPEEKDPLTSILYLDPKEEVIDYLLSQYEQGTFTTIELAGTYGPSNNYLKSLLIFITLSQIILTLCMPIFLLPLLHPSFRDNVTVAISLMFCYIYVLITVVYIFSCSELISQSRSPGYLFFTDKGIILIERGGIEKASFLAYKDIKYANLLFTIKNLEIQQILRIIDQEGQIYEYNPDWIDPSIFPEIYPLLEKRLPNRLGKGNTTSTMLRNS